MFITMVCLFLSFPLHPPLLTFAICVQPERKQKQKPSDKLACQQLVQTAESCKQQQSEGERKDDSPRWRLMLQFRICLG